MANYRVAFKNSYRRIFANQAQAERFLDHFYQDFISRSSIIHNKFLRTDMKRQKQMLKLSLLTMLKFFIEQTESDELIRIAAAHGPDGAQVSADMFDAWIDAMTSAVWICDPDATQDTEMAWRVIMAPGIAYMKRSCT